jgi:hypothetical protein
MSGRIETPPDLSRHLWTELTLTPAALAIAAPIQWVASPGGGSMVSSTIRSVTEGSSFGMREGRVLSRRSPPKPSATKRSCPRQTQALHLPVSRMIAFVPSPSALSSTIYARHACFWARCGP